MLGTGRGDFRPGPTLPYNIAPPLAVADFNGDGKSDLLGEYNGARCQLLGNGDATFQPAAPITGFGGGPIAVGDLNGDGNLDIVISYGAAQVQVLLGAGNGTSSFPPPFILSAPCGYLALADLNGDGKPGLLCSTTGA